MNLFDRGCDIIYNEAVSQGMTGVKYVDKREKTKELILLNSRKIFLKNGIVNTVMNDIAFSVNLSVRTIYRYFNTKEDIAYEIAILLINEWNSFQKEVYDHLEGSGVSQLEDFLNSLINHMNNKHDVMRYLSEFDFYFKDVSESKVSEDTMFRYNEIILKSDILLTAILELGIKDKSIRQDLDVNLVVATMSNVLWGFGQRIAIRGNIIKKESGYNPLKLIQHQVSIYIDHIKED